MDDEGTPVGKGRGWLVGTDEGTSDGSPVGWVVDGTNDGDFVDKNSLHCSPVTRQQVLRQETRLMASISGLSLQHTSLGVPI